MSDYGDAIIDVTLDTAGADVVERLVQRRDLLIGQLLRALHR